MKNTATSKAAVQADIFSGKARRVKVKTKVKLCSCGRKTHHVSASMCESCDPEI